MKSRHVLRYICDHCNEGYWEKKSCLRHEPLCLKNPDRVCISCKDLGVTQKPPSAYSDCYDWYGDVDALRTLAQGCPVCMLAAKMEADVGLDPEERWMTFDYAAEKKRIEQEKWPGGIPF